MKCYCCGEIFDFKLGCKKCEGVSPKLNGVYDEDIEFELMLARNTGGRVPAMFDSDKGNDYVEDSFGF